jgi:Fe-S-cluster containining protein
MAHACDGTDTDAAPAVARGRLRIGAEILDVELSVPSKPTALGALLPMLRAFSTEVVAVAERREERAGRSISCRAGCGACCRQAVPLAVTEAGELRELIESLPEAQRAKVKERFDAALARLREAGLLPRLQRLFELSGPERVVLGREYFELGIACPFLEDESCSIHPHRPLSCREYLVTSSPVHCGNPTGGKVVGVKLDASVLTALIRVEARSKSERAFVPMILAPYLRLPGEQRSDSGPQWLRQVIEELTGTDVGEVRTGFADTAK